MRAANDPFALGQHHLTAAQHPSGTLTPVAAFGVRGIAGHGHPSPTGEVGDEHEEAEA